MYYVIALLLSFCTNSFGFTKYVTNNLNLRYEANMHSYVLTVIPKGTAVTIDEDCNCSWVFVEYNGYVGYVSTKYLSKNPVSHKFKPNISRRKSHPIIPLVEYVQIEPDIIRISMVIVFSHRQYTILNLLGLQLFVEMVHIALAKIEGVPVRIMVG